MSPVSRVPVSSPNRFDEVLDGRCGSAAVRQIVHDPLRHGLAPLMDAHVAGGRSGDLELLRTKYKPSRKLTAYYRLTPRVRAGGRPHRTAHLAVTWSGHTSAGPETTLLVSPADPALPQLRRLSKAAYLTDVVAGLTGRQDRHVTGVDTVRYRPGQRHVLLARLADGDRVYVKTDSGNCAERAVPAAELLAEVLGRTRLEDRAVQPVGYVPGDAAALWWGAPGRPLSWTIARGTPEAAASALHRAGRVIRALHDSPAVSGACVAAVREQDAWTEARATLRAGEHIEALLPAVGTTYQALVSAAVEALERTDAEAPTLGHGDYKSDNILVHEGHLRILDLDRWSWAEPAGDLAKLLADLSWWCPDPPGLERLHGAFRAGYGPCPPGRWRRAEVLAALLRLRLAARRCLVHDPRWEEQVRAGVAGAGAALRRAGGP